MGYLKGTKSYLGGPIEYDSEHNWRIEPLNVLRGEFGIDIHDPNADDKQALSDPLRKAVEAENYELVREIAKTFVRKDLKRVEKTDFIIACVPKGVPTVGTVHEIVFSDLLKKPTLLVCPQGKQNAGKWYFGILDHNCIFGSWEDLYEYLRSVDRGDHKNNTRWCDVYGL